jgi:hypothetical protein
MLKQARLMPHHSVLQVRHAGSDAHLFQGGHLSTDEERFEHGLAALLAGSALEFDSVPSDVNR